MIDGHGPVVTFTTPLSNLNPNRGLVVNVTDKFSGVRAATLRIDGKTVERLQPSAKTMSYRPRAGWQAGATYAGVQTVRPRTQR
jgi:hypothetical protein